MHRYNLSLVKRIFINKCNIKICVILYKKLFKEVFTKISFFWKIYFFLNFDYLTIFFYFLIKYFIINNFFFIY